MLGWLVDGYGNIEEVEVPLCGGFFLPDDQLISQISLIDKFTEKGGVCMYDRKTLEKLEHEVMSELMNFNDSESPDMFEGCDEADRLYLVYRWGWKASLRWVLRKTTEMMIDIHD